MSLTFAAQAEPANGTIVVQNSRFVPDLQRTFPARLILETRIGLKSTVEPRATCPESRTFRELTVQDFYAITVLGTESKLLFGSQGLRWIG